MYLHFHIKVYKMSIQHEDSAVGVMNELEMTIASILFIKRFW